VDADFDPSVYVRAPKLDVPGAVALSQKLLAATPKTAPQSVKKAAKALKSKAEGLEDAWKARDRAEKRPDPRPVDVLADNAMSRLFGRIEGYAGLPEDAYPLAARARLLLGTLFPSGLTFLREDYPSQWAETQKRLERIDEENLAAGIDAVAGPEFLGEVRRIHKLYGEAIGVTKARASAPLPNLAIPLRDVGAAIALHALQLVAVCMDEDAPLEARAAARDALRPIDETRANAARRATPSDAPSEPEGSSAAPELTA